jgi:hypothetical protein
MKIQAFIQSIKDHPTTLSELLRVHEWAATEGFLGPRARPARSFVYAVMRTPTDIP